MRLVWLTRAKKAAPEPDVEINEFGIVFEPSCADVKFRHVEGDGEFERDVTVLEVAEGVHGIGVDVPDTGKEDKPISILGNMASNLLSSNSHA